MIKKINEFYICEEDNIFDELSALYEDINADPYADAPDLDLALEWDEGSLDTNSFEDTNIFEEDYTTYKIDIKCGDIVLARVYQNNKATLNLDHQYRPFLVIYANAYRAYGFQLGTGTPISMADYAVEMSDWEACGLNKRGKVYVDMIRGVDLDKITKYIGHLTEAQKQIILDKLYKIKENKYRIYDDCPLNDRLDITIQNVERIKC